MKTTLKDLLASGDPIITDGAMGTMLFQMGLEHGSAPELWNVNQPDKIASVHQAYVDAGSQIILTNTFGCNRLRLDLHKLSDRAVELNQAAAKVAREVADKAPHGVVVAGDIGPTGSILLPYGDMEFDTAVEVFEEQARALIESGVDVIWIETMSDLEEVRAAVEAVRKVDPKFPIVTTMTFDTGGFTMMGVSPEQAFITLSELDVLALGGNCGNGIEEIVGVIEKMKGLDKGDLPIVAKANAGIPHIEDGVPVYDATPEKMGQYAATVRGLGAQIIGGCCGSTPDHIREIAKALGK
jgi:5-methyltetrahydrofolate--homocysteine methyltransferase